MTFLLEPDHFYPADLVPHTLFWMVTTPFVYAVHSRKTVLRRTPFCCLCCINDSVSVSLVSVGAQSARKETKTNQFTYALQFVLRPNKQNKNNINKQYTHKYTYYNSVIIVINYYYGVIKRKIKK